MQVAEPSQPFSRRRVLDLRGPLLEPHEREVVHVRARRCDHVLLHVEHRRVRVALSVDAPLQAQRHGPYEHVAPVRERREVEVAVAQVLP